MRAIIQRVREAKVEVDQETVGSCGPGYLIFLGVGPEDTQAEAQLLWNKIFRLRINADQEGKTNLSLSDIQGQVLIISQFTLYADCRKGNRPSFTQAAKPQLAEELYRYFVELAEADGVPVGQGRFGADMQVSLVNDGPFTIVLDTDQLKTPRKRG